MMLVVLADPALRLPLPGRSGSFAPAGAFEVDPIEPFWAQCLADGSVRPAPAPDSETAKTVKRS